MELARNHICSPLSPYILEETETDIFQTNLLLFDDWKILFPTAKLKRIRSKIIVRYRKISVSSLR